MELSTLLPVKDEKRMQIALPLDKLYPSKLNCYDVNETDQDSLIESIKSYGVVMTPLTVVGPDENDMYEILAGERRYRACCTINEDIPGFIESLPCYVIGTADMDPIIKQLVIETSNIEVRKDPYTDLHRFHVIQLLEDLGKENNSKTKEVSHAIEDTLKISPRYRRMYQTILENGTDELIELNYHNSDDEEEQMPKIPIHLQAWLANQDENVQINILDKIKRGEPASIVIRTYKEAMERFGKKNNPLPKHSAYNDINSYSEPKQRNEYKPDYDNGDYQNNNYNDYSSYNDYNDSYDDSDYDYSNSTPFEEDHSYEGMSTTEEVANAYSFDELFERTMENPVDVDLNLDTTGRFKPINQETSSKSDNFHVYEELRYAKSWLKRISNVKDYHALNDNNKELIPYVLKIADRYREQFPDGESEEEANNTANDEVASVSD